MMLCHWMKEKKFAGGPFKGVAWQSAWALTIFCLRGFTAHSKNWNDVLIGTRHLNWNANNKMHPHPNWPQNGLINIIHTLTNKQSAIVMSLLFHLLAMNSSKLVSRHDTHQCLVDIFNRAKIHFQLNFNNTKFNSTSLSWLFTNYHDQKICQI